MSDDSNTSAPAQRRMFNPIGWMGVPPWRVPESARAAARERRVWTPQYHEQWELQNRTDRP